MLTSEEIQQTVANFQKQHDKNSKNKNNAMIGQNLVKDQLVWFRNPKADEADQDNSNKPFYIATVVQVKNEKVTIKLLLDEMKNCKIQEFCSPGGFDVPGEYILEYSQAAERGLADMVEIDELNHATLLYNMFKRYMQDDIYTYVGPILLAMNPFKSIEGIYTEQRVKEYMKIITSKQPFEDRKSLPPHIFAITAMAYKQMMDDKTKQAIVISGESGSGKTESAKRAMKFLTSLGASHSSNPHSEDEVGIEQKILDTNPVLEAFGNSKTVRNNNSSRFGKYVLLYFTAKKGEILGARVKNYLLEKSRVVGPAPGERNYHVFYHLLRGASEDLLSQLGLLDPISRRRLDIQDFNYLKNGADVDQKIVNDIELYKELAYQFQALGFTQEEQMAVWRMTAACLHLGEIYFDDSTYNENGKPCSIVNLDKMMMIGKILGFQNPQDLISEIVNKASMPGIAQRAPYKKAECSDSRDSLAKCLYDNLFNWLVERMNITILPENETDENFKRETKTIGLLDIFGFENFQENNFEQMCINYVNEKLHKLYISAIFDAEKIELKNEGLGDRVNQLKYPDLTSLDVIRCLDEKLQQGAKVGAKGSANEAKIGIFNIVNDCSTQKPRPKWEDLMKKIEDMHKQTNVYNKEKQREKFKIRHSAKEVIYNVKQFIERNVDEISSSLEACILAKADPIIAKIFKCQVGNSIDQSFTKEEEKKQGRSAAPKKTIWQKFSVQMQDLMFELAEPLLDFKPQDGEEQKEQVKPQNVIDCEQCQLHFIRCIKPNEFKVKDTFIHAMCLQQITYMGVLESIDLKQKNYPYRKNFEEFYAKYELLSPLYGTVRYENMPKGSQDFRQLSLTILNDAIGGFGKDLYAVGRSKLLMMTEIVLLLDKAKLKAREKRDQAAQTIKRSFALFIGATNASQNKRQMLHTQKYMKIKRQEMIDKRAKLFYEKALISIVKFKTEKRKDYESKAALVLTDAYKKHMFRKQLSQAIKDRQKVIKALASHAVITRLRKYYICYTMATSLADRAFTIGKQRAEENSVRTVQRIFRGFFMREKKMTLVVNALKAKENLKLHVAAKRIQKRLKGMIVRNRLKHLHLAAQRVQGFIKMKWHREFYLKMKQDVTTIQRSVRRFLARRDIIKQRLVAYLSQELSVLNNVKQIEYYQLQAPYQTDNAAMDLIKQHTPYSVKKIQLFTRVLDMHIITDLNEIYSNPWAVQWTKVCKESLQSDAPILYLQTGATHSMAVNQKGKVYCWGWNDNGQCGKNPFEVSEIAIGNKGLRQVQVTLSEEDQRVKQIVAAQDRCFVLIGGDQSELIAWGGNEKGQLGLGSYDDEYVPRKVEFFSKQGLKVSMVAAGGDLTICSCENGEAYAWPFQRSGTTFSLPVKMPFSDKIKINRVSCGFNFGFFISTQGLVYSIGKDNSEGQLGLGHIYPRDVPELILSLKDIGERIDQVECGYRHVIARSTLGKVYTWGWGQKGQLGHGHFDSEISPRLLVLEKKNYKEKAIQVAAGFSHSIVMLENSRELIWFGTCGVLNNCNRPVQVKLSEVLPELFPESSLLSFATGQQMDFAVVKITSTWSKSLALSNLLIADLRQINTIHPWAKIQSTLQQLATKWDPREVMPPYIDTVANMFSAYMMKIPGAKAGKDKNGKPIAGSKGSNTVGSSKATFDIDSVVKRGKPK